MVALLSAGAAVDQALPVCDTAILTEITAMGVLLVYILEHVQWRWAINDSAARGATPGARGRADATLPGGEERPHPGPRAGT